MNKTTLTLCLAFYALLFHAAYAQVSFSPVDTLDSSASNILGTYANDNVFPADINKDGFDDLFSIKGKSIILRLNDQIGDFLDPSIVYTDPDRIYSISNFKDINQDGNLDVVVSTTKSVKSLYWEGGKFILGNQTSDVVYYGRLLLLDYNKDGHEDLFATTSADLVLYNNVAGGLLSKITVVNEPSSIWDFDVLDFNADSSWDIVFVSINKHIKILLGNSAGTFTESYTKELTNLATFETGDLNLDGFKDLVFLEWNTNVYTAIFQPSNSTFVQQALFTSSTFPTNINDIGLVDIKNNGTPDLIFTNFFSTILKENNGSGSFSSEITLFENGFFILHYKTANLNNDNIEDLLFIDHAKFTAVTFNASGSPITRTSDGFFDDFWGAQSQDVDKDGHPDIVTVSRSGALYILWGNESNNYSQRQKIRIPIDAYRPCIFDYNNDGRLDIIIAQQSNTNSVSQLLIVESSGNRQFFAARPWKYLYAPRNMKVVDLENDGIQEVLSFSYFSRQITWFRSGNTDFNEYFNAPSQTLTSNGDGLTSVNTSDINQDGYVDLLGANSITNNVSLFINNKVGGFTQRLLTPSPLAPLVYSAAGLDYNKDGFVDVVIATSDDQYKYYLQLFVNDGSGNFTFTKMMPLTDVYQPYNIEIMDIDSDQDNDFIVSAWDYLGTNIFVNEGEDFINAGSKIITNVGQGTRTYADLNQDGKLDIFSATFSTGQTFIQYNNSVSEPNHSPATFTIDHVTSNTAEFSFSTTTSAGRIVVVTKGNQLSTLPEDNMFYASNTSYGIGASLAPGSHIVYAGKESSIKVTGLKSSTQYLVSVFEYNVNSPQANIINYTKEKAEQSLTTMTASPVFQTMADQFSNNHTKFTFQIPVTDEDTNLSDLTFQFNSSNPFVVPNENISVQIQNGNAFLELRPIADGSTTIIITARDPSGNTTNASVLYTSLIVGVESVEDNSLSVYPNPFTNVLHVSGPVTSETLTIYDGLGSVKKFYQHIPASLDLSDLAPGVYHISTSSGRHLKTIKRP